MRYVLCSLAEPVQCPLCHMWCNAADLGWAGVDRCIFCDTLAAEWEAAGLLRGLINEATEDQLELWAAYHGLLESIGTMVRHKRGHIEGANLFSQILTQRP